MLDALIGIIILVVLQFFKRRADKELRNELEAEDYNHALDKNEISDKNEVLKL